MKLSSKITYLLPFLILIISGIILIGGLNLGNYYSVSDYLLLFFKSLIFSLIVFILLKFTSHILIKHKFLRVLLVISPYIVSTFFRIEFNIFPILSGLFLLYAFSSFRNRYIAALTNDSINYENIFGERGTIPLTDVTKIEQKRNFLSIFSRFEFLNTTKKTGISFYDENLDEYEIILFMKAFKGDDLFNQIIENANKCGNLKIRQYTY